MVHSLPADESVACAYHSFRRGTIAFVLPRLLPGSQTIFQPNHDLDEIVHRRGVGLREGLPHHPQVLGKRVRFTVRLGMRAPKAGGKELP